MAPEIIAPIFKPEVILHIEDETPWITAISYVLRNGEYSEIIKSAYGSSPKRITSLVTAELPSSQLEAEINRLSGEIDGNPSLVSVITAQVAREFLGMILHGVIISDTSFPLNGKKVVEWIQHHGFNDYALIGLSGTDFDVLDSELKKWFGTTNSRYFDKLVVFEHEEEFVQQIIRNRQDNIRRYSGK